MTNTLTSNAHPPNRIMRASVLLVTALLMIVCLWSSVTLLNWTVDRKFENNVMQTSTTITAAVRDKQLNCLARNIYYEAGGESFEGKVAVAQVTINRSNSGVFPEDICKVIYQKNIVYEKVLCQFSWVCSQDAAFKPLNKEAYTESMIVAKKVLLEGFDLPSMKEAMYFHGTSINPGWNRQKIAVIGRHVFYK